MFNVVTYLFSFENDQHFQNDHESFKWGKIYALFRSKIIIKYQEFPFPPFFFLTFKLAILNA